MKVIVIGGIFPQDAYEHIVQASTGVVQYAADALQKSILCGLRYHTADCELINMPYVGAFPVRYRDARLKTYNFTHKTAFGEIEATNVGFCNLLGLKIFSRCTQLKKMLKSKLQGVEEEVVLLVYAVTPSFLKACHDIKKQYANVRIVVVVPDLPEYMSDSRNLIYLTYKKLSDCVLRRCYKSVDAWVLLSKHMTERLPVRNDNWVVMEGIYNNFSDEVASDDGSQDKYVLYAGTLAKRYGVQSLVKAFHSSSISDVKLYICGAGDSQSMIESLAKTDERIKYLGQIPREQVLQLQRNALLLVNPRTPEGEYTKFSFPSKTMEYMASGIPVLMYRLPGIPDEYFEYCYIVDGNDESSFRTSLENVLNKTAEELRQKGVEARNFIINDKNPIAQMGRVVEFIQRTK